jgi:hypothetical protein
VTAVLPPAYADLVARWARQFASVVRAVATGVSLSETNEPNSEPTRPSEHDVPSPRRGAFPKRRSGEEEAPEYVPGPAETEPATSDAEEEQETDPSEGSGSADRDTTREVGEDA